MELRRRRKEERERQEAERSAEELPDSQGENDGEQSCTCNTCVFLNVCIMYPCSIIIIILL